MKINLTQGKVALIDDEDFEKVSKFKWCAWRGDKIWYALSCIPGSDPQKFVRLHRLVVGAKDGEEVDHINYDGLDCRKGNLRRCTKSQNGHNRERYRCNTSGFKGVFNRRNGEKNPFIANITFNKKRFYLGVYAKAEDAARAYNESAKKYFGDFARINEIPDQAVHPKS